MEWLCWTTGFMERHFSSRAFDNPLLRVPSMHTPLSATHADSFRVSSILDRIRPARPALSARPRRGPKDLLLHYDRRGCLLCHLLRPPLDGATAAANNDKGIPGDDE